MTHLPFPFHFPYPYHRFVPHAGPFPYDLFDQVAKDCSDGDIIVESGAFLGHGTCFMAEALQAHGKRPRFYALDPWDQVLEPIYGLMRTAPMPWGEPIAAWKRRMESPTPLYDAFLFYLDNCPAKDRVFDHAQFPSGSVAGEWEDGTVSFVFLNYSWTEDWIDHDVKLWFPKLKPNGLLAIGATDTHPLRTMLKS